MSVPPKYITRNGVLVINPTWQASSGSRSTVMGSGSAVAGTEKQALAICSTLDDLMSSDQRAPRPLQDVIARVQDASYVQAFGISGVDNGSDNGGEMLDQLSALFGMHEIPVGLMGHLIELRHFALHFLVDDSGSMGSGSNLLRSSASMYTSGLGTSTYMTRWEEAEDRLHTLFDLLSYVPIRSIEITFMNHADRLSLGHYGKSPNAFASDAHYQIRNIFKILRPTNGTPLYESMRKMISAAVQARTPTMHYIITDGEPSGGNREIRKIEMLLQTGRGDPVEQPVSFLSCSNNPRDIEWMHESEECARNVAALHDFQDEQLEVYRDQGPCFPYSRGLWLLANLTAARDPDGLDAMDQHSPFTKAVLDNLLGRVHTETEYKRYFNSHPTNTGGLITGLSSYRHLCNVFEPDYELFLGAQVEREVPSVSYFQSQLAVRLRRDIEDEGDVNTEAAAVLAIEQSLVNARRAGTFGAQNARLLSIIATRQSACEQQQQQQYQQQQSQAQVAIATATVAGVEYDAAPSAPPAPIFLAYSTADNYQYPLPPLQKQQQQQQQQEMPIATAFPSYGGGAAFATTSPAAALSTLPPPRKIGMMSKIGRNAFFGIFESIKVREFTLDSNPYAGTSLTYRDGGTEKGRLDLTSNSYITVANGRISINTRDRILVIFGASSAVNAQWIEALNNHLAYARR